MKQALATLSVGLAILTGTTAAGTETNDGFVDTARVKEVIPLYETVEVSHPVEECWTERVVQPGRPYRESYTGALAGGLIGGVIGNRFGRGEGRAAMTVAGSLLGASIGHDLSRRSHHPPRTTPERHCETVQRYRTEEQVVGYRVRYDYKGRTFVTRTPEHPGDHIRLKVTVVPQTY